MFNDKYYMSLALDLAKSASGYTSPNPCVGAIIVKNDQIIATGVHVKAGSVHAEVDAINKTHQELEGADLYVTLEPCNHYGKTPPCTDLIIKSGIKRVIVATPDPNPLVSGRGILALKDAGLVVEVGCMQEEADKLNQVFFHYITTKTPFITLKCGMSIDAKLATKTMDSQWITSAAARLDAHNYRHEHDAILVGVNTILSDNPNLTYRGEPKLYGPKQPVRIILDTYLRTPLDSKVITDGLSQTWIVVGKQVTKEQIAKYSGIKIIQMPDEKIDLRQLMHMLGQLHITSVFVEGGYTVLTSFMELGLFNQLITYIAPLLIGGTTAPSLFMGEGFAHLKDALKLTFAAVEKIDRDLKLILKNDRFSHV